MLLSKIPNLNVIHSIKVYRNALAYFCGSLQPVETCLIKKQARGSVPS